jgi:hypothetical protein
VPVTFLDAAHIDPNVVQAIGECSLGASLHLLVALLPSHFIRMLLHLLVCDLLGLPRVRKE